jgi:hypothetical protein
VEVVYPITMEVWMGSLRGVWDDGRGRGERREKGEGTKGRREGREGR